MSVRQLLGMVANEARNTVLRARLATQVGRQTGLIEAVRLGGIKALIQSRGKTNPSAMFRYHALNQPHRTALSYRDRSYSYFELNERMDQVSAALAAVGIAPGTAVVLMLKNVPEFVFLQAGAARRGCAAVSVSWRSTAAELRYLVENSGARAIFFDAAVAEVVRDAMPHIAARIGERAYTVAGEAPGFASFESFLEGAKAADSSEADLSEEAAVVIYTSGTTGKPKGAVRKFSKDGMVQVMSFLAETPLRLGQTHLAVCPLYHSTAFGFMSLSFVLGSRIVLLDGFEPNAFLDAIEEHRVHHTAVVPTMLHRTMALGRDAIRARDVSSLEAIITGGAQLTGTLANAVMDAFGDKLYNFYGATETGFVTLAKPADLRAAPGTIGRAVGGNEIVLLDDDGNQVAAGDVGELFVRSGNLVAGYHANDDATRASMREGFFSVGDLARQDERGYFFIEGRKRDMIISGGVNVYPREVEATLCAHPEVAEAAVVGVEDDEWGEIVHAFVALAPGSACDEAALMSYCKNELAGPKRPRAVTFVDRLPRNPTGKVLKRELRERLTKGGSV